MTYDLTVLVPGIRVQNWLTLYDSIAQSTSRSWEMIFIGPSPPPAELSARSNVSFFQDYGTPIRCQQFGLMHASGEWVTWAADDGYFLPQALDVAFDAVRVADYRTVIVGKYYEGNGNESTMSCPEYYLLNTHSCTRSRHFPDTYYTLNVGLITTQLLLELGGWDAERFEVCPMAYADFAARAQADGAQFTLQELVMFKCGHMPGTSGDHGPIHYAQTEHDEPAFQAMYREPHRLQNPIIDVENWRRSPPRWARRFGA